MITIKHNLNKKKIMSGIILLLAVSILLVIMFLSTDFQRGDILLPEEREWLEQHKGKIKLAIYPDYPPIEFYDEKGNYSGVAAEYIGNLERILDYKFEIIPIMDWDLLIKKAELKEVDAISNISKTPQREPFFLFTKPYVDAQNVIIVRNDVRRNLSMKDLSGMKVVVVKSFAMHDVMFKVYPSYNFYAAADTMAALIDVSFGRADAAVLELPITSYQIEKSGITNLKVAGITPHLESMGLASRKDWPILNVILDKALAQISQTEKDRIFRKWIHLGDIPFYKKSIFWIIISGIGSAVFLMFIVLAFINRTLKRQVLQRTDELHKELIKRKHAESALVKKMEEQALLLDNIDTQVWYLIDPSTCGAVNSAFARFSGFLPIELQGKKLDEILDPLDVKEHIADNAKVFIKAKKVYSEEWIKNREGVLRLFKISKTPKLDKKGRVEYVVCAADDITDMKSQEEQLRQAQKMETVGSLASGLAHDFNNILGGITGALSIMKYKIEKDRICRLDEVSKYISMMENSTQRAIDMVQQLLTLARKQEVSLAPVDLNNSIKHVMMICESTFDKSIELVRQYFQETAMVMADPTQIEQVLLNLCVNASHAMTIMREEGAAYGGKLSASIDRMRIDSFFKATHPEAREVDYYRISISDTGIGMDTRTVAKIFDPFFTTKKNGIGTGLGLSMVYGIIKQHNGFIDVYSEKGLGSTFNLYLPVLDKYSSADVVDGINGEPPRGSGLILIVDDDEVMRHVGRSILELCGYDVITAENGEDGVNVYRERHLDIRVVLLDLVMPKKSGLDAFHEMKEINKDVVVVASSGFRQDDRVQKMLDDGCRAFVQKPYTMMMLAQTIHEITSGNILDE